MVFRHNLKYLYFNSIEPCQFTSYSTETVRYDRNSILIHSITKTWFNLLNITFGTTENRTGLMVNFPTLDVEVSDKVKILDGSSFISSVGGNLGLFLGFSFLDTLFVVYQWLCNRSTK